MTTKLTRSYRPENATERASCLRALAPVFDDPANPPDIDPAILALLLGPFAPIRAKFIALSEASDAASLRVALTNDGATEATAAFDGAFRWWLGSVRAPNGASLEAELRPLLGDQGVEAFLADPPAVKIHRMDRLLVHVRGRKDLRGDPALLAALIAATSRFGKAVGEYEAARRARMGDVDALVAYEPVFDRWYGLVAHTIRVVDPAGIVELPLFYRSRSAGGRRPRGSAGAAATDVAAADAPTNAAADVEVDLDAHAEADADVELDAEAAEPAAASEPTSEPAPEAAPEAAPETAPGSAASTSE